MRVVARVGHFKVLQVREGYVVVNEKGEYGNHAHLRNVDACHHVIRMVQKEMVPRSKFLRESCFRLAVDKEYKERLRN